MTDTKDRNTWYVAEGSQGFTMDPDQASTDIHGIPIVCPGDVTNLMKRERAKGHNVINMLWEALLDAMELIWEIEAKSADDIVGGEPAKAAALNLSKGIAIGLAEALAAHTHTALYLDPETREEAVNLIRTEAMEAFDNGQE